MTSNPLLDG